MRSDIIFFLFQGYLSCILCFQILFCVPDFVLSLKLSVFSLKYQHYMDFRSVRRVQYVSQPLLTIFCEQGKKWSGKCWYSGVSEVSVVMSDRNVIL